MDRITVAGTLPNHFNLPIWVAQDMGLLRRWGIEADVFLHTSLDEVYARIKDGRAQIGRTSTEMVILDREQGGSQAIIAGNLNRLPFNFIAQPEIADVAGLRGKTIGVSSLAAGSSSLIMDLLADHGLVYPGDYSLVAIGPMITRWDMLRSREIDAGLQGVPYNFVALEQGYRDLPLGADGETGWYAFTCYCTDVGWGETHRDLVERFLAATVEAYRVIFSADPAPDDIAHRHMKDYGFSREDCARARRFCVETGVFPADGDISTLAVERLIGLSAGIRDLQTRAHTQAEQYIDRSWLHAAWQRLGAGSA
jgi:ABC-type nitrate/sulfonate/bicarbonate transport system substrate-binding protein